MGISYLLFLAAAAYITFHFAKEMGMQKALILGLANFILPAIPLAFVLYVKFYHLPRAQARAQGIEIPHNIIERVLMLIEHWLEEHIKPFILSVYKQLNVNKDYVEKEEAKLKRRQALGEQPVQKRKKIIE